MCYTCYTPCVIRPYSLLFYLLCLCVWSKVKNMLFCLILDTEMCNQIIGIPRFGGVMCYQVFLMVGNCPTLNYRLPVSYHLFPVMFCFLFFYFLLTVVFYWFPGIFSVVCFLLSVFHFVSCYLFPSSCLS